MASLFSPNCVNYNNSLTWKVRLFWDSDPLLTHHSRARLQCYPGYVPSSPMKVGTILYHTISSGWWCNNPSEQYDFVTWDYFFPNWMESHKSHVPVTTNQSYIWVNYHISLPRISCTAPFWDDLLTKYDNLIQFTQIYPHIQSLTPILVGAFVPMTVPNGRSGRSWPQGTKDKGRHPAVPTAAGRSSTASVGKWWILSKKQVDFMGFSADLG